jgi:hypothetical protein
MLLEAVKLITSDSFFQLLWSMGRFSRAWFSWSYLEDHRLRHSYSWTDRWRQVDLHLGQADINSRY